jgi:hypothetical protein
MVEALFLRLSFLSADYSRLGASDGSFSDTVSGPIIESASPKAGITGDQRKI